MKGKLNFLENLMIGTLMTFYYLQFGVIKIIVALIESVFFEEASHSFWQN